MPPSMLRVLLFYVALLQTCGALSPSLLRRILYEEPNEQLQELGKVSDSAHSLERTFLSPAHKQAAVKIHQLMEEAGMDAYVDKVANVRGRVRGRDSKAPLLLLGSHYDTVKDAGEFDGMLGILVPIAAVKALLVQAAVDAGMLEEAAFAESGHILLEDHLTLSQLSGLVHGPIEVIAFSEEEGVRFQTTFLGSRAIVGDLIGSGVLEAEDTAGISVREALGLAKTAKADRFLSNLAYKADQVKSYVEVHMEQGPILEARGYPLGLVTGIAGQTRQLITVSGTQGHAGTIPMTMRKDPAAAAAEIISWVEKRCGGGSYADSLDSPIYSEDNLMCTTGSISFWPNAFNVIPGSANFSLDIRSKNDEAWRQVVADASLHIQAVCKRRGIACKMHQKTAAEAVHSDEGLLIKLTEAVQASHETMAVLFPQDDGNSEFSEEKSLPEDAEVCRNADADAATSCESKEPPLAAYEPPRLVSGAGHDALALAKLTKMAMLFVRCAGGHSHSPLEHVTGRDVAAASAATLKYLQAELLG